MARRPRVLISACLLGVECRYDGGGKALPELEALMERCELIPVCPEQLGGLSTPRSPSEQRGGRVVSRDGRDVTEAFRRGAGQACALAALYGARHAILKARSPSCGRGAVYDGSFSGRLVKGDGIAARALMDRGIAVYTEEELNEALARLKEEE